MALVEARFSAVSHGLHQRDLSRINGSRAIHGFGLGSYYYFNKPIVELNPSEIATLISIRGPSYYNPFRHPERALKRRDFILERFHEGLITKQQLDSSLNHLGVARSSGMPVIIQPFLTK